MVMLKRYKKTNSIQFTKIPRIQFPIIITNTMPTSTIIVIVLLLQRVQNSYRW